jgi:hypothetical protein
MKSIRSRAGALRWFVRPTDVSDRNIRNVLIDGIGVGIVSGVGTFLSVFLTRLNASSLLVGLLTSLPALTGVLLAVPVGSFLERQRNIVPWYSRARVWVLGSYALFGVLPFLLPQSAVPIAVIAIWALVTIPSTIVNVAFTLVMSGVAGPSRRMYLMSRRWSTLGVTTSLTVVLVGLALERISFPLNYQVIFIASFAGGVLSYMFSRAIVLPDNTTAALRHQQGLGARLREGWQGLLATPAFARFVGCSFVFRCGIAMALPLFPLYWVRNLHASDSQIGFISTVNSGVLLIAYFAWASWARRYGPGRVLLLTSAGMALYPLATALTPVVAPLVLYAGIAGFCAAGNDLVNFDLLLSTCPSEHQATYVGFYQTTQNLALFLMPLFGTLLADAIGLSAALIVAALLRFAGALLFLALGVGQAPAARAPSQA